MTAYYSVINDVRLNRVWCKYNTCIISTEIQTFNFGYISHQEIQYLRVQGCENPWIVHEVKRGRRAKSLGNTEIDNVPDESRYIQEHLV